MKYKKDGKVAILVSPGYGAGWKSWNSDVPGIETHPALVQMVLDGKRDALLDAALVKELMGLSEDVYVYAGGADQLEVMWLEEGTPYAIEDYDGSESLRTSANFDGVA